MSVSINRKSLLAQIDKRWLGAGLAAAGAVAAADQAKAAIVHQAPPGGVNVPSTFVGNYLNVETGVGGAAAAGWDVNPYGATYLRLFSPGGLQHGWRGVAAAQNRYTNLVPGSPICQTDTFLAGVLRNELGEATPIANAGELPINLGSADNLFGFRFADSGGITRVGWLRMSIGATPGAQPRTIVEWAYENDPQACIAAGAVPEPGSIALLAAGAIGLVARRRRNG